MTSQNLFLRFASPNEQRTISREDLGFYHAVIVGATYEFGDRFDLHSPATFFRPLQRCIEKDPYLSVVVEDPHTDKAFFNRVPNMNLNDHVSIVADGPTTGTAGDDGLARIEELLASNLDKPFPGGIPPWKIIVLPLQRGCFIAFSFSHMIGDGPTGTAFHRNFLHGCKRISDSVQPTVAEVIKTPTTPLPAPFDTPQRLPISWSFLLAPLIALLIPSFVSRLLGLQASVSTANAHTWTGSTILHDAKTATHSRLKLREVDASCLSNALCAARRHDAKLTGTFQQIITRALSKVIPDPHFTNFVSQTSINMRGALGIPNDEGGDWVSGCYIVHPRHADTPDSGLSEEGWAAAGQATRRLAESASTLADQPIGLLRYLPSIRKWTLGKLGQQRDGSFEVSNIGAFIHDDDDNEGGGDDNTQVRITKMAFAQPGHVVGVPLAFNLAAVQRGALVYTVSWPAGALGIAEDDEESFVEAICLSIEEDLRALE